MKEITKIREEIKQRLKRQKKRSKTKRWFFEKINKIDTSLGRLTKKKREKNEIKKI